MKPIITLLKNSVFALPLLIPFAKASSLETNISEETPPSTSASVLEKAPDNQGWFSGWFSQEPTHTPTETETPDTGHENAQVTQDASVNNDTPGWFWGMFGWSAAEKETCSPEEPPLDASSDDPQGATNPETAIPDELTQSVYVTARKIQERKVSYGHPFDHEKDLLGLKKVGKNSFSIYRPATYHVSYQGLVRPLTGDQISKLPSDLFDLIHISKITNENKILYSNETLKNTSKNYVVMRKNHAKKLLPKEDYNWSHMSGYQGHDVLVFKNDIIPFDKDHKVTYEVKKGKKKLTFENKPMEDFLEALKRKAPKNIVFKNVTL